MHTCSIVASICFHKRLRAPAATEYDELTNRKAKGKDILREQEENVFGAFKNLLKAN